MFILLQYPEVNSILGQSFVCSFFACLTFDFLEIKIISKNKMNVISGRQALSPCYAICMVIYTIGHLLMIHYCNRLFDKCVIKRVTSVIIMNVVMTMCSFLNACCARERMWLLSLLLFYFHVFLFRMFVLLPCISI